jgi:Photosynthetic reaction centre cytochrome C subunit
MWSMSIALGVTCDHCHTPPAFENDDKPTKQTARGMIQMVRELNAKNFAGRLQVTCFTCHQGGLRPKTSAVLATKETLAARQNEQQKPPAAAPSATAESLPDAEQLVANYRKAVGGEGVKTIHFKAAVTTVTRGKFDVELDVEMPDRMAQRAVIGTTEMWQVFDRDRGWAIAPGRFVEMSAMNLDNIKKQFAILGPVKIKAAEAPRKTVALEKIGDRTYAVVEARGTHHLQRLYFDTQTGLLYKETGVTHTTLGDYPFDTVYEDYREVAGTKMPFQTTNRSTTDVIHYDYSEIKLNQPIDQSRFEKPKTAPPAK